LSVILFLFSNDALLSGEMVQCKTHRINAYENFKCLLTLIFKEEQANSY